MRWLASGREPVWRAHRWVFALWVIQGAATVATLVAIFIFGLESLPVYAFTLLSGSVSLVNDRVDRIVEKREGAVGIVGNRWRVMKVFDPDGSVLVPTSLSAEIGFTHDGYLLGNDTVDGYRGRYRLAAGGYTVRAGGGTLAGNDKRAGVRERVIAAVRGSLVATPARGWRHRPTIVEWSVADDRLTLRQPDTTLVLERIGPQSDYLAPSSLPEAAPVG